MIKNNKFTNSLKKSVSSVIWVLKLYWRISPLYTSLAIPTEIGIQIAGILYTYIFAKGIDTLINVSQGNEDIPSLYLVVFLFFCISVFQEFLRLLSNFSRRILGNMFHPKFAEFTYKKLQKLSISTLEDPETNNLIERTRNDTGRIIRQFDEVTYLFGTLSSVITSGFILLNFAPHFIPFFIMTLIPSLLIDRKYLSILWKFNRDITEDWRKAYGSAHFLADSRYIQELRITGGSRYLSKKFESFVNNYLRDLKNIRANWYKLLFAFRIVRFLVEAYADIYIFFRFISRQISIGDVSFYIRQTANFISGINSMANSMNNIYEGSLSIEETKELFEREEEVDGTESFPTLLLGPEIKFNNVSFSYTGSKRHVIKDLNLEIKQGEKIAVVGHNGAGKTTLIKLLLRFYKLDEGKIIINNQDLGALKIQDFYKNVSVLFQDFNSYPNLTVRENISIGKDEKKYSQKKLELASEHADVHEFVKNYNHGYEQILSEKYKGGTRPSTGQLQKIAIARFFYRNSPLVIFDEPTAAIDAESEAKIFDKVYTFFKDKTVIIVSHRFSTVRNADRIFVMDKGRIIEGGTHDELMKKRGKYAKLFDLQAKGYK